MVQVTECAHLKDKIGRPYLQAVPVELFIFPLDGGGCELLQNYSQRGLFQH